MIKTFWRPGSSHPFQGVSSFFLTHERLVGVGGAGASERNVAQDIQVWKTLPRIQDTHRTEFDQVVQSDLISLVYRNSSGVVANREIWGARGLVDSA